MFVPVHVEHKISSQTGLQLASASPSCEHQLRIGIWIWVWHGITIPMGSLRIPGTLRHLKNPKWYENHPNNQISTVITCSCNARVDVGGFGEMHLLHFILWVLQNFHWSKMTDVQSTTHARPPSTSQQGKVQTLKRPAEFFQTHGVESLFLGTRWLELLEISKFEFVALNMSSGRHRRVAVNWNRCCYVLYKWYLYFRGPILLLDPIQDLPSPIHTVTSAVFVRRKASLQLGQKCILQVPY